MIRILLTICAIFLVPATLPAEELSPRALDWHSRLIGTSTSHTERLHTIYKIAGHDTDEAARFLIGYLQHLTRPVSYREFITDYGGSGLQVVLLEIEKAVALFSDPYALSLLTLKTTEVNELARLTIMQGLKETPGAAIDLLFLNFLNKPRARREHIIAIDAVGLRGLRQAIPTLIQKAAETSQPFAIRCAAMRALARTPDPRSILPLAACIREKGRIRCEARNSLWSVTGRRFLFADQYEKWWQEHGSAYTPPQTPQLHFNAELEGEEHWEEFYGLPLVGKRILFILDRSASMRRGLEDTKQELLATVRRCPPWKEINVIVFNKKPRIWRQTAPYLVPASGKNLKSLENFLGNIAADGNTATDRALYKGLAHIAPESSLETIIMLTDGYPSDGAERIEAHIKHMNRYLKVRIHTLGGINSLAFRALQKNSTLGFSSSSLDQAHLARIAAANDGLSKLFGIEAPFASRGNAQRIKDQDPRDNVRAVIDNSARHRMPSQAEIAALARKYGARVHEWTWEEKMNCRINMVFSGTTLYGITDRINKKAGDVNIVFGDGIDLVQTHSIAFRKTRVKDALSDLAAFTGLRIIIDRKQEKIIFYKPGTEPDQLQTAQRKK